MGLFDRFKSKPRTEPVIEPLDLGLVGVDMHSHLLFGIDDGATTIEDSLLLIEELMKLGYKKFITTPHIFRDLYLNSPETIFPPLEKVKRAIKEKGWDIEIHSAAEYYLDEHFEELIEKKDLLTFGNNYVLFEYSFDEEPASSKRAIFNLQLNGYKPILAHPERYAFMHDKFSRYEELADRDVYLQLNINSLHGHYGPEVKKISEKLIDAGIISFLGTDCHHLGHLELTKQVRTNEHLRKLVESGKLKNHEL